GSRRSGGLAQHRRGESGLGRLAYLDRWPGRRRRRDLGDEPQAVHPRSEGGGGVIGDVIGAMFLIVVLIVATWVAIFGGVGAMLARSYGRSAVVGLAWGTVLGPIGWLIVWLTNVRGRTSSTPARADGPSPAIGRA